MRLNKKTIILFLVIFYTSKGICQSNPSQNDIDKTCTHIDSLIGSFERFVFKENYPNFLVGDRIHYVDTLNKQYKKIILINEVDTTTKIFYYEKDNLIEVMLLKNAAITQNAKYQFRDYAVAESWDQDKLVKDVSRLIAEAKRYFSLVRYKYR